MIASASRLSRLLNTKTPPTRILLFPILSPLFFCVRPNSFPLHRLPLPADDVLKFDKTSWGTSQIPTDRIPPFRHLYTCTCFLSPTCAPHHHRWYGAFNHGPPRRLHHRQTTIDNDRDASFFKFPAQAHRSALIGGRHKTLGDLNKKKKKGPKLTSQ